MKTILITLVLLILTSCCFGQIATDKFKAEWKKAAGNEKIDTQTYEQLRAISIGADRKAFVKGLAPADGLSVWRVHLVNVLSHPEVFKYTPEQEALVREFLARFLKLDFFLKGHPAEANEWKQRVEKAFKLDQVNKATTDLILREQIKNDVLLYRYTFEIPGDTEIVSTCRPKQTALHTEKAAFLKAMNPDCNCRWAPGCDDWLPCGLPSGGCRGVMNCGPLSDWECTGFCGSCANNSCMTIEQ